MTNFKVTNNDNDHNMNNNRENKVLFMVVVSDNFKHHNDDKRRNIPFDNDDSFKRRSKRERDNEMTIKLKQRIEKIIK